MSASGLVAHPSPAELGQRYRAARSPIERSHLQIVWLLSRGRDEREAAPVTGYGRRWVGEVARRHNAGGPGAGRTAWATGGGGTPALSRFSARRTRPHCGPRRRSRRLTVGCGPAPRWRRGWRPGSAARCGPSAGGTTSRSSAAARGCRGRGTPRRRAPRSRWRTTKLAAEVGERRERNPGRAVEAWAFDEHRLGLKPVPRRRWAPRGRRPVAAGRHRYEWLYLYGFVHPSAGEVVRFVCTGVDTEPLSAVLAVFAEQVGAGDGKLAILVLDNAGWHVSGDPIIPPGIELMFPPPYTPELQPAEHLRPLANEAVANKHFATLADLDATPSERCRTLAAMPEVIKAATSFGWWPAATPPSPSAH